MNPIDYFKVKWLFKQSKLVEACALNQNNDYLNLTLTYYRLGMYEAAFAESVKKINFDTLFAKAISASYLGEDESVVKYLKIIKENYNKNVYKLAPYLAAYSPQEAFGILKFFQDYRNPLYLSLSYQIEGREQAKCKYFKYFSESSLVQSYDEYLLYANICVDDQQEKLSILNNYLNYYDLRSVSLKQSLDNLSVNNLVCNLQCNVIAKLPLVSILVPAYNVDKLIKSCINSLLKQDYKNIEILVIDDASTDETANVIRDLEAQYPQVKGIYLKENVGPFVAKNIAALHSSGEFITTQDADDWAHPERISRQVQPLLQDSNLVATTCQWLRLDENGNFYAKQHFPFKRFNPSSPMFRKRDVTKKMGLWDSVRMAADTEFIERMRLVYGKSRIRYLKQPLVIGAHRQNSLMTSIVTGNLENRISPIRLSYWEAWRNWHIQQISLGKKPYMPFGCDYTPQFKIPNLMQNDSLKLSIIYNDMLIN